MEWENKHIPNILLFYFRMGTKVVDAHKDICEVYGVDCITERKCQYWFTKFRSGDFSLKDDQCSSALTESVDDDQIETIIQEDHHITVRDIAEKLKVSHATIENHLKGLGFVKKFNVWVPHELKEIHLTQRISICDMHIKRNECDPFLKRFITGDIKLVFYNNITWKHSLSKHDEPMQTSSKTEMHKKKIMVSVWWDYKGVVYFEILPNNQTINANIYCQQLMKLEKAIKEKRFDLTNRKEIVFHHDNVRLRTCSVTRGKLLELGWEVMPHPLYSPDLSPSDYHLLPNLQNSLNSKTFSNYDDLNSHLVQFFANKEQTFYERGIMKLPERWQKVIVHNGEYINDL